MVEREAQQRTRTADPFLTMQVRGFAEDLERERNTRETWLTAAEEEERLLEAQEALESARERSVVPPRFPGGVYFIQHGPGGAIKIGHTAADPLARMATLQVGTPVRLRLLAWWPEAGLEDERDLHASFADYRLTGEWFESCHAIWASMALFPVAA